MSEWGFIDWDNFVVSEVSEENSATSFKLD
jgi:hypothetical protein